jgi:hypothetical protein
MFPRDHTRGRHGLVYDKTRHRLRELTQIIVYRHGSLLDTDDADIYLVPVAQTLRRIYENKFGPATMEDVFDRLRVWAQVRTPQLTEMQLVEAVGEVMRRTKLDKADALAARLRLTYEERSFLRITTIGACDVDKAGRTRRRKERKRVRDRARAAERRAARGAIPRTQYLAGSLSQAKPWGRRKVSRAEHGNDADEKPPSMAAKYRLSQVGRPALLAIRMATDLRHGTTTHVWVISSLFR